MTPHAKPLRSVEANADPFDGSVPLNGAPSQVAPKVEASFAIAYADEIAKEQGPVPWVCEALRVAPGRPTTCAGEGGAKKSFFWMAWMLCGADDRNFLGRPIAKGLRFLHHDYEQSKRLTYDRDQRLARGLGINLASLGRRLGYLNRPFQFDEPGAMTKLVAVAREADVHFWDPARNLAQSFEENSRQASIPLDMMGEASEITGATFILVHKKQDKPETASEVLKFFDWGYRKGGAMAAALDYVPMPQNVIELVERPMSCGGSAFWTAITSICIVRPRPVPKTTM